MKIISICNLKGGVGKTTTSINLAATLGYLNKKVLLIDIDPQANSSIGLGIDVSQIEYTIFDVLKKTVDIKQATIKTIYNNLSIVPSKLKLSSYENDFTNNKKIFSLLSDNLKSIKDIYDYVIIDCPPSLGLLTSNAMAASDYVLTPLQCEYFSVDSISALLAFIANIKTEYNNKLKILGFVLTMYDSKTTLSIEISREIRNMFRENLFFSNIPRNVSISESLMHGSPIIYFRKNSIGAQAYLSLTREIIDKIENKNN